MNYHIYLLAILIGSTIPALEASSSSPSSVARTTTSAAFVDYKARITNHPTTPSSPRAVPTSTGPHDPRTNAWCPSSLPTTALYARRGGRGRRRGRTDSEGGASGIGAAVAQRPSNTTTAAAEASLAVQHAATDHEVLGVAHAHRGVLRPGPLSQALLRIAKALVQNDKKSARDETRKDPRLFDIFMAASTSVAAINIPPSPESGIEDRRAGGRHALSAPQAADIVWACGLLQWLPGDNGSHVRFAQLVELVARTASSKSGIDDWHTTNVVWALDRLGLAGATAPAESETTAADEGDSLATENRVGGDTSTAVKELREKVESLPFQAIPSLFEELRVEDFREEVAFGRDDIQLGGGKVLSESRLTAWQSSDGLPFAYSGKVMQPSPFSPNVLRLRDALYERTGVLYDGVLLNLYETRSSAMRYHSDPDVGTVWTQDTSVVSVGDTRQFALRETLDHSRRHAFYLSSGDCVRMTAGCQRDYQHCIKVAKEDVGARISLVFKQSIAGQHESTL